MITLYANLNCPHCKKVIDVLHHDIGLDFTVRYISQPDNRAVVKDGGKLQAPYLVDDTTSTKLYESDDIIEYLKKQYKK